MLFKNTQLLTILFNNKKVIDSFGTCLWRFLENYQWIENSPRQIENVVYLDILLSGAFCI